MEVSSDYESLFKTLNKFRIKYLLIGGYAVIYHTEPRYTKDIDIWISPDSNDVERVYEALSAFGAPLKSMSPEDFKDKKMIFQMGVAPVRIDILVDIPGVKFEKAWKNRKRAKYGNTYINVLGIHDLITSKKRVSRPQDEIDVHRLSQEIRKKR